MVCSGKYDSSLWSSFFISLGSILTFAYLAKESAGLAGEPYYWAVPVGWITVGTVMPYQALKWRCGVMALSVLMMVLSATAQVALLLLAPAGAFVICCAHRESCSRIYSKRTLSVVLFWGNGRLGTLKGPKTSDRMGFEMLITDESCKAANGVDSSESQSMWTATFGVQSGHGYWKGRDCISGVLMGKSRLIPRT